MGFLIWGLIVLVLLLFRALYIYFCSPLSHIPSASILAPISRLLWEFPTEYRGQITLALPKLHQKHGPLVRIGPNQVSFYDIDIYKRVHSPGSNFVKDPRVYSQFVQDGHPALFSITDPKEHALRRRHMGLLFNRSRVPILIQMMVEEILHFNSLLNSLRSRGSGLIDLVPTCRALEADIVSRFAFGSAIGAIDSLLDGEELQIIKENDLQSSKMPLYTNFPSLINIYGFLSAALSKIAGKQLSSVESQRMFEKWANDQLTLTLDTEKTTPGTSFLKVMARERIPEQCALSEAKEMLGPGTDTTSSTLAHILYALSLNRSLQNSLVADLAAAQWPTDMSALEAIPSLIAVVKEGVRWTGSAAAMLPRIVPPGGAMLGGIQVPGGTMISSSPIWYLRDETAFPDPHLFRPSRWHDIDPQRAALRNEYYFPFSKGASSCVGIHFAYLELYLSVSQILKRYRVQPGDVHMANVDCEAALPPRREWVSAVPTVALQVYLAERDSVL
ncbi:cytochrome P450 [Aspergillus karnatakaensis]|uniref:cytochrome P450 n=1 Tax=Aspergillus karnatakaensis TaxID=1810916 RepID=UPI003CCCEFB5